MCVCKCEGVVGECRCVGVYCECAEICKCVFDREAVFLSGLEVQQL